MRNISEYCIKVTITYMYQRIFDNRPTVVITQNYHNCYKLYMYMYNVGKVQCTV